MYKQSMRVIVFDREMELYTIGKVSKMIKKSVETIRAWERQKVIPTPLFRTGKVRLYHPKEAEAMKRVLRRVGKGAKKQKIKKEMWEALVPVRKEILADAKAEGSQQSQD